MGSSGARTTRIKITGGAVSAFLCGVCLLVLYGHARQGDVTAIVILVALGVIFLVLLGAAVAMGTVLIGERIRSRQFQENALENQKLLLIQQRAQNELTRGALLLAREQQKLLPGGGYGPDDPLALVGVEDAVFDDIYEE